MKKNSKEKKWRLDSKEVSSGWHGSSSSKSGIFERKRKITSRRLFLVHKPTEIRIEGEIQEGHYSKKEMHEKTEKLNQKLFLQLEKLVARKLRIKGM